jgi:magnesium chelatase family protein
MNEGILGQVIRVEADIRRKGLPKFNIIGLPDNAMKEARDRVHTALVNSRFEFPEGVVTVNLAPAGIKKNGVSLDLAVAVAILRGSGQIREFDEQNRFFIGELSLDGSVRRVDGLLPVLLKARELGIGTCYIPEANAREAGMLGQIAIHPVSTLEEIVSHLNGKSDKPAMVPVKFEDIRETISGPGIYGDFSDISGQFEVKRAVEIAVAGRHNCLMIGPPGSGKTMIASRIPGIMPDMSFEEALETTRIYSSRGLLNEKEFFLVRRPFRSPHHSSSEIALIGGGNPILCGEISLSHNGVLFLDEFPEYNKNVIQALREPLENRSITISRACGSCSFPADLLLVAAMNPCPCGFMGDDKKQCVCSGIHVQKYYQKISGPILDRIDIHVSVPRVDVSRLNLREKDPHYSSSAMKERILRAMEAQKARFAPASFRFNAALSNEQVFEFCKLDADMQSFLNRTIDKLGLSLRAYFKILKLARTIADLEGSRDISIYHLSEAVQYRVLDRYNSMFSTVL